MVEYNCPSGNLYKDVARTRRREKKTGGKSN
jgi:hypothetical protein